MRTARVVTTCAVLGMALAAPLWSDDEPELGWSNLTELGFVTTSGNAEATSLTLKNTLKHQWEGARFTLDLGALNAESETRNRFALANGAGSGFSIIDNSTRETTAESYYLKGRYDRDLNERMFWFAGAGWERNELAGVANRWSAVAGLGNVLFEREDSHFRLDYGVTFTSEESVATDDSEEFAGLRLSWDYLRQLTESTSFSNLLVVDQNLDEGDDLRADMINALSVAINSRLALKTTLQLLFDNMPAFESIPLLNEENGTAQGSVLAELDDLDTLFTVTLVVTF